MKWKIESSKRRKNCVNRIRLIYKLEEPVDESDLFDLKNRVSMEPRIDIQDFRHIVPNSKPLFSFNTSDESFLITGSLGSEKLEISYPIDGDVGKCEELIFGLGSYDLSG